ncbi:MAG: hypothetical protein ACI4AO_03760 [Anaerotignum sp.]
MHCAISPKPIRAAEELANGTAETFLNGCEGDGKNGGRGLQSKLGRRRRRIAHPACPKGVAVGKANRLLFVL